MEDDRLRGIQWRLRPELSVSLPHRKTRTKWWRSDRDPAQEEITLPMPRSSPENRFE